MSIALLCPNGHKLVCPESQAGKRGKCPHCGAIFRVPDLTASGKLASNGAPDSATNPAPVPVPVGAAAAAPAAAPVVATAATESAPEAPANPIRPYHEGDELGDGEIAFLCPNGHHLCGRTELGGQPGECPECGVKFLVPTEAELVEPAEEPSHANPFLFDLGEAPAKVERPRRNSRGEFFERLWEYRNRGATIELYLDGGTVLTPDGYAAGLSKQDEGVFLVQESDGTYTVAVVAWETITHMAVRGLDEVPEGVFDVP
ncbi:MAG TPA: hypothetical protein VHZ24_01980 [Pirellulales bacterium]|jgi:hypothetical protein|nr:hypothetical protein [Pirellulales bacterium]